MRQAGFWRRGAAWSLDASLVALPVLALSWRTLQANAATLAGAWNTLVEVVAGRMAAAIMAAVPGATPDPGALLGVARASMRDPALLAASEALQSALLALAAPPLAAFVALFLLWCVGFERSRLRATPGKRALGLQVVSAGGGHAATGALLLRFAAGALSWLSLNVGHALAAVPPDHAALHDRISRTRVVLAAGAAEGMPRWAAAWLVVQVVALLVATAWGSMALGAAMQAALDRALWG